MTAKDRTQFSMRFLLPVIIAAALALIGLMGLLSWSAHRIDAVASGQTIAWLHWQAAKPGSILITETLPALIAGVVLMTAIV